MEKQSASVTEPPVAKTPRFAAPVTEGTIQQALKTVVPKSTQADTSWRISLWTKWAKQHNGRTLQHHQIIILHN